MNKPSKKPVKPRKQTNAITNEGEYSTPGDDHMIPDGEQEDLSFADDASTEPSTLDEGTEFTSNPKAIDNSTHVDEADRPVESINNPNTDEYLESTNISNIRNETHSTPNISDDGSVVPANVSAVEDPEASIMNISINHGPAVPMMKISITDDPAASTKKNIPEIMNISITDGPTAPLIDNQISRNEGFVAPITNVLVQKAIPHL